VHTDSQTSELNTWASPASLVLTGPRAQVEVVFADLQRKYGDDLEVVKGPFQHRGSRGRAAGLPRGIPRVDHGFLRGFHREKRWGLPAQRRAI
jgi:hypothetical protein